MDKSYGIYFSKTLLLYSKAYLHNSSKAFNSISILYNKTDSFIFDYSYTNYLWAVWQQMNSNLLLNKYLPNRNIL